jgi:hypothetical protein
LDTDSKDEFLIDVAMQKMIFISGVVDTAVLGIRLLNKYDMDSIINGSIVRTVVPLAGNYFLGNVYKNAYLSEFVLPHNKKNRG